MLIFHIISHQVLTPLPVIYHLYEVLFLSDSNVCFIRNKQSRTLIGGVLFFCGYGWVESEGEEECFCPQVAR